MCGEIVSTSSSAFNLYFFTKPLHRKKKKRFTITKPCIHLFSYFCAVTCSKDFEIIQQRTCSDDLAIPLSFKLRSKQNIVSDCCILDPGFLGDICKAALFERKKSSFIYIVYQSITYQL